MIGTLPASTLDRRTPLLIVLLLAGVLLVQVAVGYRSLASAEGIVVPACIAVFGLLLLDAIGRRLSRRLAG
jgi:purine-cytosine permease-like protein